MRAAALGFGANGLTTSWIKKIPLQACAKRSRGRRLVTNAVHHGFILTKPTRFVKRFLCNSVNTKSTEAEVRQPIQSRHDHSAIAIYGNRIVPGKSISDVQVAWEW